MTAKTFPRNARRAAIAAVTGLAALGLAACGAARTTLSSTPNIGPCPQALALYDASRFVEIKGAETFDNVGFTGEVQKVQGTCRYFGDEPIRMNIAVDFGFGRGPAASGRETSYRYFVAVTRKDSAVIKKEYFDVPVRFGGDERVFLREEIGPIVIPRADENVSGVNFEVLVGFELTPEQLEFNRSGKRFRVNAGS